MDALRGKGLCCPSKSQDCHGELQEGLILGLGNPLLDISAVVGEDLLKKYDLKANDAIMAESKHLPLYKELTEKYNAEYIAGGSVQNSMRVIQWMLKKPHVATYMGCVGDDEFANTLRAKAEGDGVQVLYQVNKSKPTGTCAVLLTSGGSHRSLCANLAAAELFSSDHLSEPTSKAAIEKAKAFYTSGFFIAVSMESIMQIGKHAHEKNLLFVLNVSAPFVMHGFKEPLEQILPYVDLIFGNELEAEAYGIAFNSKSKDLEDIAKEIAAYPKLNTQKPRLVVITRSAEPIIVVEKGEVKIFPVKPLKPEEIVDTNGAGDAFTGGFISQILAGKPLEQCVQGGVYAAVHVIKNSGCTFSAPSDFKPTN